MLLWARLALVILALVGFLGSVGFWPAQWGDVWWWTFPVVIAGITALEIARSRGRGRRA